MNPSPPEVTESAPVLPAGGSTTPIRSTLGRIALLLAILVAIAAVAGMIPRWRERATLRSQTASLALPTVIVASPVPGKASGSLTLPAEVRPFIEAPIYARASGFLKRWLVDLGAKVEAGELLAEIDTPELNQELARSRAELAQAEAALALSRITAVRWADLLKTASVSEQEAAEKQSDLALKAATLDAARANVRRLEEMQSFARVTAPFAGIITARKTDVGELIAAGSSKELFRLAQISTLRVYVHVPQMAVRNVHVGDSAALTLAELPGRVISAQVVRTAGAMDAPSRTLLTELAVDNAGGEILAGSYAQVRLPEAKLDPALTIPSNTLLFRAEGPQVGLVHPDGTVELRSVHVGRDFGAVLEVLNGLTASDRVIVNPSDSLVSGVRVRVAESAPSLAPSSAGSNALGAANP